MNIPNGIYAPAGVYVETSNGTANVGTGPNPLIPVIIGPGSEILSQNSLELVRGSGSNVDQRVVQEDAADRAVTLISPAGQITLGAFNGTYDRIQVRNYPIVTGNGSGTTATDTSSVSVTVNGSPVVVLNMDGARGVLKLSVKPTATDVVYVTYYFNRSDTLITDDVSDQVSADAPVLYGSIGQSYEIITGTNDVFTFTVDDVTVVSSTISASPGVGWTAAQIAAFVNSAASATSLVASAALDNYGQTVLRLTADKNITIGNGNANSVLGFTSGAGTFRNNTFYVFQRPVVDGSGGGITSTDPADVTVKVNGTQVIPSSLDGQSGAVVLPFAPKIGSTITVQYYFNSWQDTFDYLAKRGVSEVLLCGVTPDRSDYVEGVDFVLQDDKILWGTAVTVDAGEHTVGSSYLNNTQVLPTLVDVRQYLAACSPVVNTAVSPPVENRLTFTLPLTPTTGNGRNSPLGTTTFNQVANGRIDLPTNRPDLVWAYWGFSLEDALDRGRVTVNKVDSDTGEIVLSSPVPVGATVYATFYYNTIQDEAFSVQVVSAGPSGVGTYTVVDSNGNTVLTPTYGSKSAGLSTVALQFPSGSERMPDVRIETPFDTTYYEGPVLEDVTVEFASQTATLAEYTVPGSGPYYVVNNASDIFSIDIDNAGAIQVDLGLPTGTDCGFSAQLVGNEVSYEPDTGGATFTIDSTNNLVDLQVDGVVLQGVANSGAGTVANFVNALNRAAIGEFSSVSTRVLSGTVTVNNLSPLVTGVGTAFTTEVAAGDTILIGAISKVVQSVDSATQLTMTTSYGAGQAGVAATITSYATTRIRLGVGASDVDDFYVGKTIRMSSGLAANDSRTFDSYDGATRMGTVSVAFSGSVASTDTYHVFDSESLPVLTSRTKFLSPVVIGVNSRDDLNFHYTGSVTGASGVLTATIAPATYTTAALLAAAVQTAIDAQLPADSFIVTVSANSSGQLEFALTVDPTDTTGGFLEFTTDGTAAEDFAILAGLDTDTVQGGQTKLVNGLIAKRFTFGSAPLTYDRIILRNRIIPGQGGSLDGQYSLDQSQLLVLGGTGASLTGLVAQETGLAGIRAAIMPPTLYGAVGFVAGVPAVTFYAADGVVAQNNVFKFTFEGVPVTVQFTDSSGVAIPSGESAVVPLGPAGTANTILNQINAAMSAAGLSATARQEGAGIRFRGLLSTAATSILIGNGNANSDLGFSENTQATRDALSVETLVSGLMAHQYAALADYILEWSSGSDAGYFVNDALAKTVRDGANADYLFLQSKGNAGAGTTSSLAFDGSVAFSVTLPGTGLGVVEGSGNTGEAAIEGFFVTSSDSVNGSGTSNTSVLNSGVGQDGSVGQTYRDLVTGLTFTVLPRAGSASYPVGETFTFKCRANVVSDSNLPVNTIPGVQLVVTNTNGVGVGDSAVVTTNNRGGAQPAVGDIYYVSYEYLKQDFSTQIYTKFASIEAAYGPNSPTNPVTLASYLAMLNGGVIVAVKQTIKDEDSNSDGTNDASSSSAYMTAIDELEGQISGGIYPDVLIPLKGDDETLFNYIARHCDIQSSIRYRAERTCLAGFSAGTQPRDAGNIAAAVGRTRFRLVYPDIATLTLSRADGANDSYLVDGTYLAAALAGNRVSPTIDVATPWTNARLFGFDQLARVLSAVEQNQVAVRGVTILEDRTPVIRVRQGFTTDMTNVLTKLPTIVQISDNIQKDTRASLDRFIGVKFLPGILSQIEGQLSSLLKGKIEAQIITAYTGVSARTSDSDPTTAEVEAAYSPVFPLLFLLVSFSLRASL